MSESQALHGLPLYDRCGQFLPGRKRNHFPVMNGLPLQDAQGKLLAQTPTVQTVYPELSSTESTDDESAALSASSLSDCLQLSDISVLGELYEPMVNILHSSLAYPLNSTAIPGQPPVEDLSIILDEHKIYQQENKIPGQSKDSYRILTRQYGTSCLQATRDKAKTLKRQSGVRRLGSM